jgi:hypothetical protein
MATRHVTQEEIDRALAEAHVTETARTRRTIGGHLQQIGETVTTVAEEWQPAVPAHAGTPTPWVDPVTALLREQQRRATAPVPLPPQHLRVRFALERVYEVSVKAPGTLVIEDLESLELKKLLVHELFDLNGNIKLIDNEEKLEIHSVEVITTPPASVSPTVHPGQTVYTLIREYKDGADPPEAVGVYMTREAAERKRSDCADYDEADNNVVYYRDQDEDWTINYTIKASEIEG